MAGDDMSANVAELVEAEFGIVVAVNLKRFKSNREWEAYNNMSFYEFFLHRMEASTGKEPKTVEQLLGELDISKAQLTAWLKRAMEEGKLKKTKAPVRYAWLAPDTDVSQVWATL
jgi:hypothetical protein